jgi:hypothetical protein
VLLLLCSAQQVAVLAKGQARLLLLLLLLCEMQAAVRHVQGVVTQVMMAAAQTAQMGCWQAVHLWHLQLAMPLRDAGKASAAAAAAASAAAVAAAAA